MASKLKVPDLKYPYLAIYLNRHESSFILCRGVGLHTYLGISVDLNIGQVYDEMAQWMLFHKKKLE